MTTIILEVPDEAEVAKLRRKRGYRVVSYVTPVPADLPPEEPPARRTWAGSLSDADAQILRKNVEEVRNEWERDF